MNTLRIHQLSSLAKVFPDRVYGNESEGRISFKGQEVSYQIAIMGNGELRGGRLDRRLCKAVRRSDGCGDRFAGQ